jgi:hypothetical protein
LLLLLLLLQELADVDRRAVLAGVELSNLQGQLAEARGERDASQVRPPGLLTCWSTSHAAAVDAPMDTRQRQVCCCHHNSKV